MKRVLILLTLVFLGIQAQPIEEWVKIYSDSPAHDASMGIGIDDFNNIYI